MSYVQKFLACLVVMAAGWCWLLDDSVQTVPWADEFGAEKLPYVMPQIWHPAAWGQAPQENRGEEYYKYLKVSLRIRNGNVAGSGTICYYDSDKHLAYVISCGHLFHGGEKTVELNAFYKNSVKLPQPVNYTATVMAVSPPQDRGGEDISFMSFQPDWEVDQYYPIAPANYPIVAGKTYYSCGCDGAREVACYLMKAKGIEGKSLVLTENGPRHGRSGGGLLTDDGMFVGICWGSSDPYNGTGKGLFVPLSAIHAFAKSQNLDWLVDVQVPARRIPIIDWMRSGRKFSSSYVRIP